MSEQRITLRDAVMRLVGEVRPVGETHTDDHRFQNLQELTALVDRLVAEIDSIAYDNKDVHEHSIKRAADHCAKFLDDLGIQE